MVTSTIFLTDWMNLFRKVPLLPAATLICNKITVAATSQTEPRKRDIAGVTILPYVAMVLANMFFFSFVIYFYFYFFSCIKFFF